MTFAEKIRILRKDRGLTQTELGDILGVQTSAVSKWEKGRVDNISRDMVKKMCAFFNLTPSELLCLEELPIDEIENIFNSLNEKGQDTLLNYARFLSSQEEYYK